MVALGKGFGLVQRFIGHRSDVNGAVGMRPVKAQFINRVGRGPVQCPPDVLLQRVAGLAGIGNRQVLDLLVRDYQLDLSAVGRQAVGI
ncbi:hypothetical protein [uncultured Algoriphagus sp.]|uniref:hypothetical protein n=1 Tax=uncultured Algoriphagus sp. TaxID=417365 RepID=UPI0025935B97|nr:hypothetical protein [uncultured Algoriphagus sp.]